MRGERRVETAAAVRDAQCARQWAARRARRRCCRSPADSLLRLVSLPKPNKGKPVLFNLDGSEPKPLVPVPLAALCGTNGEFAEMVPGVEVRFP